MAPEKTRTTRPRRIALTGFMGSGKTTVGAALAQHLGWEFVDLDAEIERGQRLTIPELFRLQGEAGFRSIESALLRDVLQSHAQDLVLALGGGTFVQPANAELLRATSVHVVFLETPLETMLARCCGEPEPANSRPLAADPVAFRLLYESRLPSYRTADWTISTAGKEAADVATEIVRCLPSGSVAASR